MSGWGDIAEAMTGSVKDDDSTGRPLLGDQLTEDAKTLLNEKSKEVVKLNDQGNILFAEIRRKKAELTALMDEYGVKEIAVEGRDPIKLNLVPGAKATTKKALDHILGKEKAAEVWKKMPRREGRRSLSIPVEPEPEPDNA